MSEIRNISTIQDNLLLCYDLAKIEDGVRNIDYIYISRFLSSLNSEELMSLWTNSISPDYVSDLDLVYDLCEWIIPKLEELEWYESCHSVLKVTDDCKLYLANFPNI